MEGLEVSGIGVHNVEFPKYKELCLQRKYADNMTTLYSIASTKQYGLASKTAYPATGSKNTRYHGKLTGTAREMTATVGNKWG